MTKVTSTNLTQKLGGVEADWKASLSKYSMYRLATMGLTGDPIALNSEHVLRTTVVSINITLMLDVPQT